MVMKMMEPEYIYIKGQGWVPHNGHSVLVTFSDGVRALAERRTPNPGERFVAGWADSWCESPGVHKLQPDKWSYMYYAHLLVAESDTVDYYNNFGDEANYKTGWVTFTIV